jgi:hypothetical protein
MTRFIENPLTIAVALIVVSAALLAESLGWWTP